MSCYASLLKFVIAICVKNIMSGNVFVVRIAQGYNSQSRCDSILDSYIIFKKKKISEKIRVGKKRCLDVSRYNYGLSLNANLFSSFILLSVRIFYIR